MQHSSPALTSEYYSIVIGVQNKEAGPVADLRVGVALTESLDEMQPTGGSHDDHIQVIRRFAVMMISVDDQSCDYHDDQGRSHVIIMMISVGVM